MFNVKKFLFLRCKISTMPRLRADLRCDPEQSQREHHFLKCPKCGQKLADLEYIRGIAMIRFQCRRCHTYVKADLVGVD